MTMMIPVSLFRLNEDQLSDWKTSIPNFKAGTYAVCLCHVYIAVCVIIHLLVDTTDSLVAENGILVLA